MRVTFEPTAFENSFGPYQAVLSLNSGDTLCTTTLDSRGRDGDMVVRGRAPNPLTGPFYVEGAEPGDALAVDLLSIRPNRAYGYSSDAVAAHVVDATAVTDLPERGLAEWAIDQAANTARLSSPIPALAALELPLSPMLGCIGVAPPGGQTISSATSGSYGGNMDYRGIVAGTTLMLPVSEPGALLFVGDGHAVQGDGEIVGMGIEISMEVSLRVRVLKRLDIRCPRGISATSLSTTALAPKPGFHASRPCSNPGLSIRLAEAAAHAAAAARSMSLVRIDCHRPLVAWSVGMGTGSRRAA